MSLAIDTYGYPNTVRIVLSDCADFTSVADAINESAIDKCLTKPLRDEQLLRHVREAFKCYELKYENARLLREIERANSELFEIKSNKEAS